MQANIKLQSEYTKTSSFLLNDAEHANEHYQFDFAKCQGKRDTTKTSIILKEME